MNTRQQIKTLKRSVQHYLKHWQNWRKGYPQCYARVKETLDEDHFGFLWGECVTPIKQRLGMAGINENRRDNMQLAIDCISGLVLQPREIFSFWDQVPQPTVRNGFRAGPMLIKGKLKTDVGGGLCQISTTLLGAFLMANCEMLEHHNHSIDVHGHDRFFVLGQDAAVAYGYKDLIARNQSSVPLQLILQLATDSTSLTASLWGTEPTPHQVKLTSDVIDSFDSSDPFGKSGWRVETQRWVASKVEPYNLDPQDLDWQVNYRFISLYHPFTLAS